MQRRKGVVLIVDDDDDSRDAMVEAFHQRGFAALAARNGRDALETFNAMHGTRPDVIVLDLAMPVMDGHEFLAARAERPELSFVPVIIISGTSPDRDLPSSVWNEYIAKPVQLDAVVDAVARCTLFARKAAAH